MVEKQVKMKNKIIKNISINKPKSISLPKIPNFENDNSILGFIEASKNSAATAVHLAEHQSIEEVIQIHYPNPKRIVNCIPSIQITGMNTQNLQPRDIHPLDLAIIKGVFGVVENGAIWVDTRLLPHRIIPFIAEHLVIVLSQNSIVGDMHDAYQKLEILPKSDFGVFIAGPSKTADIEQCLVIGAQGPRSLLVVITNHPIKTNNK